MTRELLERLPETVAKQIEECRRDYDREKTTKARAAVRARNNGYTLGLRDAGLITERERQTLFVYTTV